MHQIKTAIIDIGSNTMRLVIYKYDRHEGLHEIGNMKVVARLRTYILPTGEMTEEGIALLEDTLRDFLIMLDDFGVSDVRAAATAAIRQASNRDEIITRIHRNLQLDIELLSEQQEAYFGFVGVAYSLATPSAVTIDIGGGSTEITLFKDKEIVHAKSFPFGTVSLKQMFVKGEVLSNYEQQQLAAFVKDQFAQIDWITGVGLPVVGIGGSARNIAQVHQQRINYDLPGVHGYEMSAEDLRQLNYFLGDLTFGELKQLDGLSSDRADIILPALTVFRILLEIVGTTTFQLTKKGLREGLVMDRILQEDAQAFSKDHVFETHAKQLAAEYNRSEEELQYLTHITEQMYEECCRLSLFSYDEQDRKLLLKAAKVYGIGEYIELSSASQHTFYLIANQSIDGLNHKDRIRVALLASYKNKDYFAHFIEPFEAWFTDEELHKLRDLGALLKFVYAFNVSKRRVVDTFTMHKEEGHVCLTVQLNKHAAAEKYQARRHQKHLERVIKENIIIHFNEEGLAQ
ncbi:exopolyphosphatase [Lysinibacillus alkalisoli]|uniref:Exopolyphosphatase n=1 Tax=Lysinibacillus alkalisoli TaxID=1911548 RepID=A0A917LG62_9BACI|nr:Ppx/GppA phosphatase family protein [Lysinibacillus alkalisoli]GGG20385.1 exopolyphosphatase [Lysinibacillus alkalisoli]